MDWWEKFIFITTLDKTYPSMTLKIRSTTNLYKQLLSNNNFFFKIIDVVSSSIIKKLLNEKFFFQKSKRCIKHVEKNLRNVFWRLQVRSSARSTPSCERQSFSFTPDELEHQIDATKHKTKLYLPVTTHSRRVWRINK